MYQSSTIAPGVQKIRCPAFGRVYAYLVQGEERALLIDNGFGNEDIRPFLQTLTDLPIMAANTHAHPDHAGSNPLFGEVWIGEHDVPDDKPMPFPHAEYPVCDEVKNSPPYRFRFLRDGDRIDLGGREVTVCEVPGHSPGHIVFADSASRLLISGDAIARRLMLFFKRPLDQYREALQRADALDFDDIYCGHWDAPLGRDYIRKMLALMENLDEAKVKTVNWHGRGRLLLYSNVEDDQSPDYCSIGYWADENHIKPQIKR